MKVLVYGVDYSYGASYAQRYPHACVAGIIMRRMPLRPSCPIFTTVEAAFNATGCDTVYICTPPAAASKAVQESLRLPVQRVICHTATLPAYDLLEIEKKAEGRFWGPSGGWVEPSRGLILSDVPVRLGPSHLHLFSTSTALLQEALFECWRKECTVMRAVSHREWKKLEQLANGIEGRAVWIAPVEVIPEELKENSIIWPLGQWIKEGKWGQKMGKWKKRGYEIVNSATQMAQLLKRL